MAVRAAAKKAPTAIAMFNMGGPSTLPEVQSFLTNLFTDPELIPMGPVQNTVGPWVAKRRTPKIEDQYAQIGGGSPILKWTNIQGENLCKILDETRPESAPHKHYVFFRYADPLTEQSLKQMKADGVTRAVAFSQYPQWSCTTSGSSMNQLWRELDRLGMKEDFKWSLIDRWNTHPGYIAAVANRVKMGLEQYAPEDRDKVIIMFSAHSVPMKTVYKGDSYVNEIAATAERVMKQLAGKNPHILSWQSKVGYLPWMGPSTSDVIARYGKQGHKCVAELAVCVSLSRLARLLTCCCALPADT
jgi:ferrochelatase